MVPSNEIDQLLISQIGSKLRYFDDNGKSTFLIAGYNMGVYLQRVKEKLSLFLIDFASRLKMKLFEYQPNDGIGLKSLFQFDTGANGSIGCLLDDKGSEIFVFNWKKYRN